jgi:hypothetical protein
MTPKYGVKQETLATKLEFIPLSTESSYTDKLGGRERRCCFESKITCKQTVCAQKKGVFRLESTFVIDMNLILTHV